MKMLGHWTHQDLRFVVETLVPERRDPEHVIHLLREDEGLLDAMLQDERLFRQLMDDEQILLSVSPDFFFKVLLVRARHDLKHELYTIERRHQQKVVLFDANRVAELLARPDVCNYLAAMLASFTRIESTTIPVRVRRGIWYRLRVNDLDVDSLLRYAQVLDEEQRFRIYRRIGDACLFLCGIFPEYAGARQLYPPSQGPRLRLRSSVLQRHEDFETYGQAFYQKAARHEQAGPQGLADVLKTLSSSFILAEKPLTFIAQRYLSLRKHRIFDL
jgi:hypothetical protein